MFFMFGNLPSSYLCFCVLRCSRGHKCMKKEQVYVSKVHVAHLGCLGGQSQLWMWLILSSFGASHVISGIFVLSLFRLILLPCF